MPPDLSTARLGAAVGPNQKNAPDDVRAVQRLIDTILASVALPGIQSVQESGVWDGPTAQASLGLERTYFYGDADPFHRILPDSEFFEFLKHAAIDADHKELHQHLSSELYQLAATMVPAGADKLVRHKGKKAETRSGSIREYLPSILQSLAAKGLADVDMLLVALATIRAETAGFVPIPEGVSKYNTSPRGTKDRHAFDLYDDRTDLGNTGSPDGSDYRGRGFVQLTGRSNYAKLNDQIGLKKNDLIDNPDDADDPDIAARILAQYMKNHESWIRSALKRGDLASARRSVNGGSNGLADFKTAFQAGRLFLGLKILEKARAKAKHTAHLGAKH